jgi:hypothetical protein
MRAWVLATIAVGLAACGPREEPPPAPDAEERAAGPQTWFICDAIDAPVVLAFVREGETVRVAQYEKPSGALIMRTEYSVGGEEGAAGSIYTTLVQNGAEAGAIRQLNPGMLETPASAYTLPFTSVRIGAREISCRWLPRTRLMGFTGRRTIVVHEDPDGDLLYTSYDFASAAEAEPVELSENARTTTFSLEARDGAEAVTPQGTTFTFRADSETQIVVSASGGEGAVEVRPHGSQAVQSEPLLAFVEGDGGG